MQMHEDEDEPKKSTFKLVASVNDFCYFPYSSSISLRDNPRHILPPVTEQIGGTCSVYATLCAVEARFRKRTAPTVRSTYTLSIGDLLQKLKLLTGRDEDFFFTEVCVAMGAPNKEDGTRFSDGLQLYDVNNQAQHRLALSSYDEYDMWYQEMNYDDVVREIRTKGPVVATIHPRWDFNNMTANFAFNYAYGGTPFEDILYASDEEQFREDNPSHMVALIGFGGRGENTYYIAQNSYGLDWGANGVFKVLPSFVEDIGVPRFDE